MSKNLHIVKSPNGWGIRKEGNSQLSSTFATQREAISKGREMAIQGSHPCTRMIIPESAQKWLSEKVGFQKAVKIPVFCYLQPQICVISFSVDKCTSKYPQRLKTRKTPKTAVYKL